MIRMIIHAASLTRDTTVNGGGACDILSHLKYGVMISED